MSRKRYYNWRRLGALVPWWNDQKEQWEPETPLWECPTCFVTVTNPGRHRLWHEENDSGRASESSNT